VLPGSYHLFAQVSAANNLSATTLFGATTVEVTGTDVGDIVVPLETGFEVMARVSLEGGTGDASEFVGIRVGLQSQNPPRLISAVANPQVPGTFSIRSVLPGTYTVYWETSGVSLNYYRKFTRLNAADISRGVRLEGPPREVIELVFSKNTGTIAGTVVTATQQASAGATIAAVPTSQGAYRSATADAEGNFSMPGVPPGEYRIFAFEDIERFAWQNTEYMRPYQNRGTLVRLEEGGRSTLALTVIPAGQ
jgi:hypothetical protein